MRTILMFVLAGCDPAAPPVGSREQSLLPCYYTDTCDPTPSSPPVTVCTSCASAPNATPVAVCSLVCTAGWADCNHLYSDGCETSLNSLYNCGACGRVCSSANGVAYCSGGTCGLSSCNSGWGNCDGNAANGCETNLLTSTSNCGACGVACATCNNGVCATAITPVCGDGICSPGESCVDDCGCPGGYVDCCGDGSCYPSTICFKLICP
jgi:hypothetical protein